MTEKDKKMTGEGSAEAMPNSNFQPDMLMQAQKMEALGRLVSGVAHEINNPVNLIMYSIPILKKVWRDILPLLDGHAKAHPEKRYGGLTYAYLKENLFQILSDAELAADRITKIVSDLKNFARQTNMRDTGPMQVNTAVENALRLAQTTVRKSGIGIVVELAEDLPLIEGNLQSIEQVVLNLVINAIQAIDHGHGTIRVSTEEVREKGAVVLTVEDNGRGIDPKIADKLFDPFATDKQAEGGTGLGLSVTYSLVRAHGGKIRFETGPHEGTTFSVTLPLEMEQEKVKILVVDDEVVVREVLRKTLNTRPAYVVDEAPDGISACIKLGAFKPDLLILDIFMPEMNGLEVCRVIKSDPQLSDLKVIITTGYPGHRLIDEVNRLGFENVLSKPFKISRLMETVEKLLGT